MQISFYKLRFVRAKYLLTNLYLLIYNFNTIDNIYLDNRMPQVTSQVKYNIHRVKFKNLLFVINRLFIGRTNCFTNEKFKIMLKAARSYT